MKDKPPTNYTRGVSFSPVHWDMLEAAIAKGFKRSTIISMALDALKNTRPDIFLSTDYQQVIKNTDKKSVA